MVVQTRAVVLADADRCAEPIFIVGPHRSGTSLVRRLFNSHPDIACPPESFYITHYAAMLEDRHVRAGYDGFGYDDEQMRLDLAGKAASLHEAYRLAQGKRIWADKTPHYALHLEAIDRLFAAQPRYVLVLRHPGDVVHSLYRRGWRLNGIDDPFESALEHVRNCLDALLEFETRHPRRCVRLVYEDLCDQPEPVLARAMVGLGLQFHPAMLRFADHHHNFGVEDPVVRGTRRIAPRHGDWRSLGEDQKARVIEFFGTAVERMDFWHAQSGLLGGGDT
ncbi:MAG: sulfotransferase family protein [Alphaproteobacteria bacterium]